jgi:hypothetical protein
MVSPSLKKVLPGRGSSLWPRSGVNEFTLGTSQDKIKRLFYKAGKRFCAPLGALLRCQAIG